MSTTTTPGSAALRVEVQAPRGALQYPVFRNAVDVQLEGSRDVEDALIGGGRPLLNWFVDDLSRNGSYTVVLTPRLKVPAPRRTDPLLAGKVTRGLVTQLQATTSGVVPQMLSMSTMEKLEKSLTTIVEAGGRGVQAVDAISDARADLDERARTAIQELVTPAFHSTGTLTGRLETIGRRPRPYATVWDEVTGRGIRAEFDDDLLQQVLDAFGQRVVVTGTLLYDRENRLTRLKATALEVVRPDHELPTVREMAGRFPSLRRQQVMREGRVVGG